MRVTERLQHGLTAVGLTTFIVCAAVTNIALGQIITSSEPYGDGTQSTQPADGVQDPQQSNQPSQDPHQSMTLDEAFYKARQAVAYGEVGTATQVLQRLEVYAQQSNQTGSSATSQVGDSVEKIRSLILRQTELAQMATDRVAGYNEQAASFLLQQAAAILKYNDTKTAEMLANQAGRFPVDFAKQPIAPNTILGAVAKARAGNLDEYTRTQLAVSEVLSLMSQAQLAFDKGNLPLAKSLTDQAKSFEIADTQMPANQTLPWQLELKIQDAMRSQGATAAVGFEQSANNNVVQADYDPTTDTTKNVQVAAHAVLPGHPPASLPSAASPTTPKTSVQPANLGMHFFEAGMVALKANDLATARQEFEKAWQNRSELDPNTLQTVQDQLTNLPFPSEPSEEAAEELPSPPQSQLSDQSANVPQDPASTELIAGMDQKSQFRELQQEIFRQRGAADRMRAENPHGAITLLTDLRTKILQSELSEDAKRPLFTMIDRDIADFQKFVNDNLSAIQLDEENAAALADVYEKREKRYATEMQIQKLVEEFDDLMDEQRYAEARMVAKQAEELSPDSEIVSVLKEKSQIAINEAIGQDIKERKEQAFIDRLNEAEEDSINNVSEYAPVAWGDRDRWSKLSQRREAWLSRQEYSTSAEREIWNLLKNEKVQGHYQGTLQDAVNQISEQTGVNIIFDQLALSAESISSSSAVDVPIRNPISLQSALNVILGNSGLVFVVEDEVIKVTSRDVQRRDLKRKTYYIGDLVTPIQNFQQSLSMNFMTPNGGSSNGFIGQGRVVPLAGQNTSSISQVELAQQSSGDVMAQQLGGLQSGNPILGGLGGGPTQTGTPTYSSIGPQSLGGVTENDFQPLIRLIRNTIDPDGWDDTNGDGTIQAFVPNLSLIVSQTQEVQDQIQDLLQQLRELNDVQIVVEVRFVSLSDSFFERIGIDFDFNLNDNSGINPAAIPEQVNPSAVVGLQAGANDAQPSFSPDLDIPFQQTFFSSTMPTFGGFDVGSVANFGFAILSDIEVFFLIQASKGDSRTNVTQAPTLTMFNGQVATVTDGAQVPFVTSVTPVVGDFSVAQQPIITLYPDGTSLNVQAVVSNDRKSVRMTLVPFFSQITNVDTFTFDGSTTTQRASDQSLIDDLLGAALGTNTDEEDNPTELETTTQGVTIQLPTLGFTSVSTVVSVPDGGTILLGGIKRQREQRIERGVPFLSNVPYVSRLFKNVGIARDTSSLMMMVTPRIIIQEEEELEQTGINSRDQ